MVQNALRILWIEDKPGKTRLLTHLTDPQKGSLLKVEYAPSIYKEPKEYENPDIISRTEFHHSSSHAPDIIVLDLDLAIPSMLEILSKVSTHYPQLPIVIISNVEDESAIFEALRKGAQDYLIKSALTPDILARALRDAVYRKRIEKDQQDVLSTVSHELKAPTAIIREGISQILEQLHGPVTPEQKKFLEITRDGIDRLKRMVDELFDVSRMDAGKWVVKKSPVALGGLIQDVVRSFELRAEKRGIEIQTHLPSEELKIFGDSDKIVQVLVNLVGNAVKFTDQGTVSVRMGERDGWIECEVSDTGRGIAAQDLPRIFEKYEQVGTRLASADRGMGLGLSIVRAIIEHHGGTIRAQSKINAGSTFTFTLPRYTARQDFQEYVSSNLQDSSKKGDNLSVIIFGIDTPRHNDAKSHEEQMAGVLKDMASLVQAKLREKADRVFNHRGSTMAVLSHTAKQDALVAAKRIQKVIDDELSRQGMAEAMNIYYNVVSFPDDAKSAQELMNKAIE